METLRLKLHFATQTVVFGSIWICCGLTAGDAAEPATTASPRAPSPSSHWAFRPVKQPVIPGSPATNPSHNPVDLFIEAKLKEQGLVPAPAADRRTLIRRVTFDLIGLPPAPEEIDAFLADRSPQAFSRVVDRLLQSRHYGERWGHHWLDVARFAETTANDSNAVMRYAWRYRDYVVDAFNRDLPYDQFIVEQLAGDLLPASEDPQEKVRRVIATGFLMVGPKALAETDKEQVRLDVVDEQIDVIGRSMLGLTLACARCHDHKFDPVPTTDYYGLAGILRGTEIFRDENPNAQMWQEWSLPGANGKPMVVMAPKEGKPIDLRVHVRGNRFTLGEPAARRLPSVGGANATVFDAKQSGRLQLARWIASPENPLTARVMVNRIWQHHFGNGLVATPDNFGQSGEQPSHPELLDWLADEFVKSGWSVKSMHRRMLLSDVYQRSSVVPGTTGSVSKWLERMPRRRLDAESIRDAMLLISGRLDPTVGGDESGEFLFKNSDSPDSGREYFRTNRTNADHPYYTESRRRSLYLPVVRNALPDVLSLFDAADPNAVTAARRETIVPPQALFLMNHPFVRVQSRHFAEYVLAGPTGAELRRGYLLALGREPNAAEVQDAETFLREYQSRAIAKGRSANEARFAAWQSLCQTLLCRNEFLYVD